MTTEQRSNKKKHDLVSVSRLHIKELKNLVQAYNSQGWYALIIICY